MDRLVAALNRRQRREVEQLEGAKDDGHQQQQHGIEVELRCIRPFDSGCVAFLDGFLYGNTNSISSLNVALCELSSRQQSQDDNTDDCEREDRIVSRSTTTTALDVICRFLACPRVRHTSSNSNSIALKSITFMACHLTNENARRIIQALHFGNRGHHADHHQTTITQLDLSRNELHGAGGGVILGEFLTLLSSQLTHFNISRNPGLGPDAMTQSNLRQGFSKCKKLVKLSVHGCKTGNVGLSQLCLALDIHDAMPLEEFDIGDNDLQGSMAGVCLAFIVQHMTRLKTLDISRNPQLGADGILAVGKALVIHRRHEFLQTLSISDCGMGNTGIEVLDQVFKESLIGRHNNNNTLSGIYKSLTHFHLARNNICNGAALGSLLQPFVGLQRCTLSGNPLGLNGAADLGPVVVQFCHSLQHLQMTNCRLGNIGIDYMITQVFAKCPSLQTIQLGSNHDAVAFLSPTMLPLAFVGNGHVHQSYQQHPALCYQEATLQQPEKCAACQVYYRENADIEKLPCGRHYLHSSCLHSWRNGSTKECPFRHVDDKEKEESTTVPTPAKANGVELKNFLGQAMQVSAVTGQEEMLDQEDEEEAMAVEEEEHTTTMGPAGHTTVLAPTTTAAAALQRQPEEWHSADEDDDDEDGEVRNKSSTITTVPSVAAKNNTAHTQRPAARNDNDNDDDDDDDDDDESTEVVAAPGTQFKAGNEYVAAREGGEEE